MMFCWEQRRKLYMMQVFQMHTNKTDPLLDSTVEPDERTSDMKS